MKRKGLGARLFVAGWGIPLLLGLTYLGGWWTALLVTAIGLGAQYEYYQLQEVSERHPLQWIGLGCGVVVIALWFLKAQLLLWSLPLMVMTVMVIGTLRYRPHGDVLATLGGLFYPPLLAGTFIVIRQWVHPEDPLPNEGMWLAISVWGAIWVGDSAAYFGGRAVGRRKLASRISPKKTVAGSIFGVVGSLGFGLLWWQLGLVRLELGLVVGLAAGTIGQIGDLVESALKRDAGVKDSSGLLPGHGGLLDRFDSFMMTAPVVAVYLLTY